MTEIEQHIQALSVMQAQYSHIRRCEFEWQAIEAAKDALREKQEREKGCGWCRSCNSCDEHYSCPFEGEERPDTCDHYVHRWPYCPMCGRPLTDK